MDMEAKTIGHPLKQIIHLSHSKTYQLSKDKHQGSFNYFSPTSVSWLLMQVYCPKQSLASRILRVLWTYFKYRPLTCTHTKKSPLFSDPRFFSLHRQGTFSGLGTPGLPSTAEHKALSSCSDKMQMEKERELVTRVWVCFFSISYFTKLCNVLCSLPRFTSQALS